MKNTEAYSHELSFADMRYRITCPLEQLKFLLLTKAYLFDRTQLIIITICSENDLENVCTSLFSEWSSHTTSKQEPSLIWKNPHLTLISTRFCPNSLLLLIYENNLPKDLHKQSVKLCDNTVLWPEMSYLKPKLLLDDHQKFWSDVPNGEWD